MVLKAVPAVRNAKQGKKLGPLQEKWSWVETSVWTDRMLAALENGVKGGKWAGPIPFSLSMGFSP